MEFKVTEEFIREAHGAACSTWKQRIEKEFPDLFKTELEVGKWYKGSVGFESLIFITEIVSSGDYNKVYYYGFFNNAYCENDYIANRHHEASLILASNEEIESTLIAEAKKIGFKKGVMCNNSKVIGETVINHTLGNEDIYYDAETSTLRIGNLAEWYEILRNGKWAEILPEEKTIITKGKALRIIAKKLKVSPESIEIQ